MCFFHVETFLTIARFLSDGHRRHFCLKVAHHATRQSAIRTIIIYTLLHRLTISRPKPSVEQSPTTVQPPWQSSPPSRESSLLIGPFQAAFPVTLTPVHSAKQATLAAFFGTPKPGPRPSQPKSSQPKSSPASTFRTPSTPVAGSSPAQAKASQPIPSSSIKRSSPLKQPEPSSELTAIEDEDDELTPPPKSDASDATKVGESSNGKRRDEDEVMDDDEPPIVTVCVFRVSRSLVLMRK